MVSLAIACLAPDSCAYYSSHLFHRLLHWLAYWAVGEHAVARSYSERERLTTSHQVTKCP